MDMMKRIENLLKMYTNVGHVWYIEQAQNLIQKEIERKKKETKTVGAVD